MSEYRTVMAATANEDGLPEIELVYRNGIFRDLFRLPERREVLVYRNGTWYDKESHIPVDLSRCTNRDWVLNVLTHSTEAVY